MRNIISFIFILLIVASCETSQSVENVSEESSPEPMETAEERAVTQAVLDTYEGISFDTGTLPDFDKLGNGFVPYATFVNFRSDTAQVMAYDEFLRGYQNAVEGGGFTTVVGKEIYGKTEVFGKIAHRISTYITYINDPDTIRERGVNSFQLVMTDEGWKISSIIWDVEKEGQPIPPHYDPYPPEENGYD